MRLKVMFVRAAILALSLALPAATAQAGPIISNAGDHWKTGLEAVFNQVGTWSGDTVAIAPHSDWALTPTPPSATDAVWISYALTGISPNSVLAPVQGSLHDRQTIPVMSVSEDLTAIVGSTLTLKVWADDTAKVYLSQDPNRGAGQGTPLFDQHTWAQSTCETYPISCAPGNFGAINYAFTAGGNYQLWFDVYQVGMDRTNDLNPFGLLYAGSLSDAPVPEPGSIILLGTGLFGLAGVLRRRIKK